MARPPNPNRLTETGDPYILGSVRRDFVCLVSLSGAVECVVRMFTYLPHNKR